MIKFNTLFIIFVFLFSTNTLAATHKSHAIALHGKPKYKSWFSHFDYTNPDAPKKGTLKLATQGTFDSLNPFIAKGNASGEIGFIYDSLTVQSADEPYTQYGLIARTIEWPDGTR